jgi:hypothetical protein
MLSRQHNNLLSKVLFATALSKVEGKPKIYYNEIKTGLAGKQQAQMKNSGGWCCLHFTTLRIAALG